MPRKNIIKTYVENGIYHIYNRGNDHKPIFYYDNDYFIFLELLKRYLSKPTCLQQKIKNYHGKIQLFAFCLMENHFHFLLKQISNNDREISQFMQSLQTSYSLRFNFRHSKTGHLCESNYKARVIESGLDLISTSKYIHLNPSKNFKEANTYPYSSIRCYTASNKRNTFDFIETEPVLSMLSCPENYMLFLRE